MGMREAEIAALRWDNVDLQKRLMTVSEATSIDVNNTTVIKKPKSVSGNRTLPIPEIVCEALQRHRNDDKELVVPLSCAAIYKRFKRILHSTGIHDFRFHDLRHPYVKPTTKKFYLFSKFNRRLFFCLSSALCFCSVSRKALNFSFSSGKRQPKLLLPCL